MIYRYTAMMLGLALVLPILPGCVGYRLGSTLPPDVKAIYVKLFINKCNEPLLEIDTTNATIAEFQKDGTLRIVPGNEADVILETTLNAMTLTPLRYDQTIDKAKPNEYRLTLHVSFVLKRAKSREIMNEASVIGESTFVFIGNLNSSKRAAIPAASEDLAKRIVEKVVETW
ncbi:MAG: LptE family protein [Kiritimatiellae bacterium]|nr:LptE family protein [Kiritimatiellia bacterium]